MTMTKLRLIAAAFSLVALAGVANASTSTAPQSQATYKVVAKPMQTVALMTKKHMAKKPMKHKKKKKYVQHVMMQIPVLAPTA